VLDMPNGDGLGLSVHEAIAHGLPLVLADLPRLRSIAGPDHFYVDGRDPVAVAAALRSALSAADVSRPRTSSGKTWDAAVNALLSAVGISEGSLACSPER
jgi:glycosyltransferase involved in cell wall biosynthesis